MAKSRTTVLLDEALLMRAKESAFRRGVTFTKVVEEALSQWLLGSGKTPAKRIRLRTHGKGGFFPGMDISDTSALLDLLDGQ